MNETDIRKLAMFYKNDKTLDQIPEMVKTKVAPADILLKQVQIIYEGSLAMRKGKEITQTGVYEVVCVGSAVDEILGDVMGWHMVQVSAAGTSLGSSKFEDAKYITISTDDVALAWDPKALLKCIGQQ